MGIDAFMLQREEIVFAAFGGWEAGRSQVVWLSDILGESPESPS
jgi:hypothetical protein